MTLKDFFTNEAISNYIVFFAGILVGLAIHLRKRLNRQSPMIEVIKQQETSLLRLQSVAQNRLKVTYEDQTVNEFHETTFSIRNKSNKVIEIY